MKSIASVAILVALIAQVVSAATDVCPEGFLEDAGIGIITTDTYIANGCSISYDVQFIIELPENESTTYVTVENSTILSYSLSFILRSWSLAPFAIVVQNNLFNLNTYLYVTGTFAKNSSVTIQGNKMSANDYTYDDINLIYFNSVNLNANASLNIVNNVLNVSNQNSYYTEPIYFDSTSLDPFGSVNILRNTITATGNIQGTLIYIDDSTHYENSTWRVMGNTLTSTSTSTVAAYGARSLYGEDSAVYVFSNNFVNVTNTVEAVGSAVYVEYSSYFLLSIDNNQINYNVEYAISFGNINLLSGLSISGNAIHSTNGTLASPVIMAAQYNFLPNATYVMSNNKVTATSVTNTDAPLLHANEVRLNYYYVQDNSTKIHYCGNTLPWSNEPAVEQLFSSELLDYVVASCIEVTRPASSSPLRSFGGTAFGIVISAVVAQLLL